MLWTCSARPAPSNDASRTRAVDRVIGLVLTWITCSSLAAPIEALAQSLPIVRVEEDWKLVVGEPDPDSHAPQITCVMSPAANLASHYMYLELNHQTLPEFSGGGVQLQVWEGDEHLDTQESPQQALLSHTGEVVTWTQSMHLQGGQLTFGASGTSTSWGTFGGQGKLQAKAATSLSSLSGYQPSFSVAQSGVGYAANRVTLLVLKEVRYYSAAGLVSRDTSERQVHPQ